jgi:integrase
MVFHHPLLAEPYHEVRPLREVYFEPTLKRLGLRRRDMYQTRHTCASLALMAGVHPTKLAAILGDHARLIYETYAKWIEEDYDPATMAKLRTEFGVWLKGTSRPTVPRGGRIEISCGFY